jgi:hypothetical protein
MIRLFLTLLLGVIVLYYSLVRHATPSKVSVDNPNNTPTKIINEKDIKTGQDELPWLVMDTTDFATATDSLQDTTENEMIWQARDGNHINSTVETYKDKQKEEDDEGKEMIITKSNTKQATKTVIINKGKNKDKSLKGKKQDKSLKGKKGDKSFKGKKQEKSFKGKKGDKSFKGKKGDKSLKGKKGDKSFKGKKEDKSLKGKKEVKSLKGKKKQ